MPAGKFRIILRRRQGQKTVDTAHDFAFGVDHELDIQTCPAKDIGIFLIFLIADTRQFHSLRGKGVGKEAGDQIHFVVIGDRNDIMGVFHMSQGKRFRRRPRT